MRSVHDNVVTSYLVDCERRQVTLHTNYYSNEYTDVVFTAVVAHFFEHVLLASGNILFDVEQVDAAEIVDEEAARFSESWRWGWPDVEYDGNLETLKRTLHDQNVSGFRIDSSLGLSGWVLAERCELREGAPR